MRKTVLVLFLAFALCSCTEEEYEIIHGVAVERTRQSNVGGVSQEVFETYKQNNPFNSVTP